MIVPEPFSGAGQGAASPGRNIEHRFLRTLGVAVIVLNMMVAALSLSDIYLLASGAVKVKLPTEKDFTWRFDSNKEALVFTGNYSVHNDGFYDITDLNIDATVRSENGVELVKYRSAGALVPAYGGGNYTVVAQMPVDRLLELDFGSMLFSATHFYITVKITAQYVMGMARFHSEETINYTWTPPLRELANFILGGNASAMLRENFPLFSDLITSVEGKIASCLLAEGKPVAMYLGGYQLVFTLAGKQMDVCLFEEGEYTSLCNLTIPVPEGGD